MFPRICLLLFAFVIIYIAVVVIVLAFAGEWGEAFWTAAATGVLAWVVTNDAKEVAR